MAILILITMIFINTSQAYAAKSLTHYSYNDIYSRLQDKYKDKEYIYLSDNMPVITFATYNDKNYSTSVKKTSGKMDLLYCCDYSKHIIFDDSFVADNDLFNDNLRSRIGLALYYGTTSWGAKAKDTYTTGNFITDYYMTQVVIHALIYKYGGSLSHYGINFDNLHFKSNTATLKKKAKAMYDACCKASVIYSKGNFQSPEFSFEKSASTKLTKSQDYLYSEYITCNADLDGASVRNFKRTITDAPIANVSLETAANTFDSKFRIKLPIREADQLKPGIYNIKVKETVNFERYIAGFWRSTNSLNQETAGLITNETSIEDKVTLQFVIGNLDIIKKDSYTDETIPDAIFDLYQFNDNTNQFEYYKRLTYNTASEKYESGNIYVESTNSQARFRVVETQAGANYKNDWKGAEFCITQDVYHFVYEAENEPIGGSLTIKKNGEYIDALKDNAFVYKNSIPMEGITFSLYADSDIYKKKKILFKKGQKIVDFVTDKDGIAKVRDLPMGSYYFKEIKTLDIYELDSREYHFSITRDDKRKYCEKTYDILNVLKKCMIHVYKKSDGEKSKSIALPGAHFGLYCKNNIMDIRKHTILPKDSLIAEGVTDEKGELTFSDLPYEDYYLKELEAPEGYIINDGIIPVNKDNFEALQISNEKEQNTEPKKDVPSYRASVEVVNKEQHFQLQIHKNGEAFTGIVKQNSGNGEYYQYLMTKKPLEKVTFSLYSDKDILIATKQTDANGNVTFTDLPVGKYYVTEDSCPDMYMKENKKEVIIKPDGRNQLEFFEENADTKQPLQEIDINNTWCTASLSINKQGEAVHVADRELSFEYVPLKNVVFGVYQNFEYRFSSEQVVAQDTCVGYLVTNADGTAQYCGKLPEGQYYIKEQKAPEGYEIDTRLYNFEVKADQHKPIQIQLENNNHFINRLSKASVQIIKTDANNDKPLKGVEFTLYNEKDKAIGVYKTDRKGKINIKALPYGDYYFVETKARRGYYATNNKYHFHLDSEEGIVLNITNSPILKLGFEERYKQVLLLIISLTLGLGGFVCIKAFKWR